MLKLSQNHPHKLRLRRAKPLARVQLGVYVQLRHTTKKKKGGRPFLSSRHRKYVMPF